MPTHVETEGVGGHVLQGMAAALRFPYISTISSLRQHMADRQGKSSTSLDPRSARELNQSLEEYRKQRAAAANGWRAGG